MIEMLFELSINLIETLIVMDFLTKYFGAKFTGIKKQLGFIIFWLIAFVQLCMMNLMTELETISAFIPLVIYVSYSVIFLKGGNGDKLWMSFLTYLMMYIIAGVTNFAICNIIGYNPKDMISIFNSIRVTGVIITKIILFYITRIVLKTKYKNSIGGHKGLMLFFVPAVSLVSLGALMKASLHESEFQPYILIGIACIVLADIMTYYFFVVINKDYENTINAKLIELQNENLKKNIDDNELFIKEMKTVRHDIKHQLLTILNYINNKNNEEASTYISSLLNTYLPNVLNYINTGNMAFDAIVNSKIAICNQKNIFMELNIKHGTKIGLEQSEIAVLFGNLLDNAIEAAQNTKDRRIIINIHEVNDYLSIIVKNSICESVLQPNSELKSTKLNKDLHGIGIKSIRSIIDRYNGMLEFYEEDNHFCCSIMLEKIE